MSIEQVRLFELQIKGDRLDEINAEEVLDRRAAAHARNRAFTRNIDQGYHQTLRWCGGKLVIFGQYLQHHAIAQVHEPA
jgi:hypothetical protein